MSALAESADERAAGWDAEDDWTGDALHLVRDLRSPHRRKRAGQVGYIAYCVLLLALVWGGLPSLGLFLQRSMGADYTGHGPQVLDAVPSGVCALALGCLLLAARDAVWRGPVVPPRESVDWMLAQPVRIGRVLRPWLWGSAAASAAFGVLVAAIGTITLGLTCDVGLPAAFGWCVVAGAGIPLLSTALATGVEASERAARWTRRLTPYLALLVPALGAQSVAAVLGHRLPLLERIEMWSGPWGWAAMAVLSPTRAAVSGGPVAALLLAVVVLAGLAAAHRLVGSLPLSAVRQRSRTAIGVMNALRTAEFRNARQVVSAAGGEGRPARWRLPLPRAAWLAVPWRDALSLLRVPVRLGRAVVIAVLAVLAGVFAAGTHGKAGVAAGAVALAFGYWSVTQLLEPARVETDDVRRGSWAPYSYRGLMFRHTAVPAAVGLLLGAAALVVLLVEGAGVRAVLAPAAVAPMVASAVVSACRGPARQSLLMSGPQSPVGSMGPALFLVWYGAGPLVAVAALLIPFQVALHDATVASVVTAVVGDAVVTALMLRWAVLRIATLTAPSGG